MRTREKDFLDLLCSLHTELNGMTNPLQMDPKAMELVTTLFGSLHNREKRHMLLLK
jgi:hypothetical protein